MTNSAKYDIVDDKTQISFRKAFTLIELLVVIAIISLLVSILLPSLQRARDLAKVAVCTTNIRQWGVTHALYAQENAGLFIYAERPDWTYLVPETVATEGYVKYFMETYSVAQNAFKCPFVDNWFFYNPDSPLTPTDYTYLGAIDENVYDFFHNDYHSPVRMEEALPSWVLMTDKAKGWQGPENTNHWLNNQMAVSLLFVDGHVEHQNNVWDQSFSAVAPFEVMNYGGAWSGWDYTYRILWNK